MKMKLEEKIGRSFWFVLNKIKENSLLSRKGEDVEYWIHSPPIPGEGMPFPVNELRIIYKLAERGCVKIKPTNDRLEKAEVLNRGLNKFTMIIYLEILQPKFDETYKEYEGKFQEEKKDEKKTKKGQHGGEIYKIECVERKPNIGKLKVVINEDYSHPLEVNYGKYWQRMYKLAGEQRIVNDKGFLDYFNSNSKNLLYSRLGYEPTQVLKYDGAAAIIPAIEIELITEKKLNQRGDA